MTVGDTPIRWLAGLVLVLLVLLYAFSSTGVGLIGPDEPRYVSIGRQMAESGNWVDPVLWGQPWFEKPPLTYWLIGAGHVVGLPGEAAARVPIAVLAAIFLLFFYRELIPLLGIRVAWPAVAMLGTSGMWCAFSSLAVTDLPLAATFSLGMVLAWRGVQEDDARRRYAAGALFGLAVLAKVLVAPALALPLLWMIRKAWRRLLGPALLAALIATPWYVAMLLRHGRPFWDELFVRHHFARFASESVQHVQPWWFYVPVLVLALAPWFPLLGLVRPAELWREPKLRLFALWVAWGFVFLSAAKNKLPGYVMPLLPALAVLLAWSWDRAGRRARWVMPLAALVLGMGGVLATWLPDILSEGLRRAGSPRVDWSAFAVAAVPSVAVWWLERAGRRMAAAVLVAASAASLFYLKAASWPALDLEVTARPLWQQVEPHAGETCLDEVNRAIEYGLNYYGRHPLPPCQEAPRPYRVTQRPGGKVELIRDASYVPLPSGPVPARLPQ